MGSGIHYSLKHLPIIHLIKIFAYSLKSILLFIKKILKILDPSLFVPYPCLLGWFFTHWLTNYLNHNTQEMPFCFPCACVGLHGHVFTF